MPSKPAIDIPLEAIAALCEQYQVKELALFGSVLREDFRPESDVDVLVEFLPEARIGLIRFFGLQRELSSTIGRRVDLVPKKAVRPRLRQSILGSAETVYARG
jgi:hypothetical protein